MTPPTRRCLSFGLSQPLRVMLCALYALCAAPLLIASVAARLVIACPMPPAPDYPRAPQLSIIRHEAVIRCDLDTIRGPLTCAVRVTVEFSQPMPTLIAEGMDFELFYQKLRWLPTSTSADQRTLTFAQTFSRAEMQFTASVEDISAVETRHPLTVDRWMVPVFPISYSAPALLGAPLHLTIDLPDTVSPRDFWLSLSFSDSEEAGRHVLTEVRESHPSFSTSLEGPSRWTRGGPLLGVACNIRAVEGGEIFGCPTFIAGWEVSYPDWLLYGLVAEVNLTRSLALIPSVETALWIENGGVGFRLGLPVEVLPDPRVGLRALVTFSTWAVTGGIGVDVFPWQPSYGQLLSSVIQVQFSL